LECLCCVSRAEVGDGRGDTCCLPRESTSLFFLSVRCYVTRALTQESYGNQSTLPVRIRKAIEFLKGTARTYRHRDKAVAAVAADDAAARTLTCVAAAPDACPVPTDRAPPSPSPIAGLVRASVPSGADAAALPRPPPIVADAKRKRVADDDESAPLKGGARALDGPTLARVCAATLPPLHGLPQPPSGVRRCESGASCGTPNVGAASKLSLSLPARARFVGAVRHAVSQDAARRKASGDAADAALDVSRAGASRTLFISGDDAAWHRGKRPALPSAAAPASPVDADADADAMSEASSPELLSSVPRAVSSLFSWTVNLPLSTAAGLEISALLTSRIPTATLVGVEQVWNRVQWRRFAAERDNHGECRSRRRAATRARVTDRDGCCATVYCANSGHGHRGGRRQRAAAVARHARRVSTSHRAAVRRSGPARGHA
jgi:hypothetical protein